MHNIFFQIKQHDSASSSLHYTILSMRDERVPIFFNSRERKFFSVAFKLSRDLNKVPTGAKGGTR